MLSHVSLVCNVSKFFIVDTVSCLQPPPHPKHTNKIDSWSTRTQAALLYCLNFCAVARISCVQCEQVLHSWHSELLANNTMHLSISLSLLLLSFNPYNPEVTRPYLQSAYPSKWNTQNMYFVECWPSSPLLSKLICNLTAEFPMVIFYFKGFLLMSSTAWDWTVKQSSPNGTSLSAGLCIISTWA